MLPVSDRTILYHDGKQWLALIERTQATKAEVDDFNVHIAKTSQQFIFGPTEASVKCHDSILRERNSDVTALDNLWPFTGEEMMRRENDWMTLFSLIEDSPSVIRQNLPNTDEDQAQAPDPRGQHQPSGLYLRGNGIRLAIAGDAPSAAGPHVPSSS